MIKIKCFMGVIFLTLINPVSAFANDLVSKNLCESDGVTVSFFNGVDNTLDEVVSAVFDIEELAIESFGFEYLDSKRVDFSFFYNNTEGMYDDIQEVFQQRNHEFINNYYEISVAIKNGNRKRLDQLLGIYPESEEQIDDLVKELNERIALYTINTININSDKNTELIYSRHKKQIDELDIDNKRMIFVAHSQGNLFMNLAYDYSLNKIRESDIRALHIAPASQTLRGDYFLSYYDTVINALRLVYGENSVPETNIDIPFHLSDVSGHKFLDTYMNRDYYGVGQIMGSVHKYILELYYKSNVEKGFFSVSVETEKKPIYKCFC